MKAGRLFRRLRIVAAAWFFAVVLAAFLGWYPAARAMRIEFAPALLQCVAAFTVGASAVLLSKNGCVVVCEGADSPAVVWEVVSAVAAYTGIGSDKISVYPMGKTSPQRVIANQ